MNAKQSTLEDEAVLATDAALDFERVVQRMPGVAYRCQVDEHLSMRALTQGVTEKIGRAHV